MKQNTGNLDCVTAPSWAAVSCPAEGNPDLLADYAHDYANRLTATRFYNGAATKIDSADYVTDPLDRPVKQTDWHQSANTTNDTPAGTTTTTYTYLGTSNAVSAETAVEPSATKTRSYAHDGLGQRATLAETSGGSTSRYSYLYDPHGSVSLLLDNNNAVKASYGYSAYGSPNTALTKKAAGFSATTNPYRYTGKRFDTGSNTLDMGARRYSASAGRFLQYDQYWGALNNLGLSLDPINANRYLFTGANPINYIEIDGHRAFFDDEGRLGIVAPPAAASPPTGGVGSTSTSAGLNGCNNSGRNCGFGNDISCVGISGQQCANRVADIETQRRCERGGCTKISWKELSSWNDFVRCFSHRQAGSCGMFLLTALPTPLKGVKAAKLVQGVQKAERAAKALSPEIRALSEAHLTGSGKTVLGHFPGYVDKAKARGASYFDIGDAWNGLSDAERWAANRNFLDRIASSGDQVLLSTAKTKIRPGSPLAREVQYLTSERGYRWVNQWSLRPR